MSDVRFNGKRLEITLSASRELSKTSCDLYDVLEILEEGYYCNPSKRKQNIQEKCLRKGNKEYKAVLADTQVIYPDGYVENILRVIHFGVNTFNKKRRRQK